MSGNPDDERLEELRKQKMEELQDQQQQEEAQQQAQQQANAQKQALLRQYLTDGARKRLNSVRMSKPQFAEQVEQQILAIAQSGRINGKIDDAKMKELLRELKPDKTSFNIKRR
ncbi:DNA-binding protein [Haladaptatus sp. R4]|uniref:DNA-binding protein n=1 Tax=Haladaptatus sp. R4 TaxID=1679489 RepID=UPI0007B4B627|nr:DNA-binding protein [Haladaptatus sp. R4]KZN25408.1 DNA-binding protein [Haladaptatus sp. R4]